MKRTTLLMLAAASLGGCNVVPPLDCLMGVQRPGCQRDANGEYRYLYTSPLAPAPNSDAVPVGYPAPQVVVVEPAALPPVLMPVAPSPVSVAQPRPLPLQPMLVNPPPVRPLVTPAAQQQDIAGTPQGTPMGVVVPFGGGNNVVVSPEGQPLGVSQ